jgi:hypothetical protein
MTYIDPEVYDWEKLKGWDRAFIEGYNTCMERVLNSLKYDKYMLNSVGRPETLPTITKIFNEYTDFVRRHFELILEGYRIDLTCGLMEGNESYLEDDEPSNKTEINMKIYADVKE